MAEDDPDKGLMEKRTPDPKAAAAAAFALGLQQGFQQGAADAQKLSPGNGPGGPQAPEQAPAPRAKEGNPNDHLPRMPKMPHGNGRGGTIPK